MHKHRSIRFLIIHTVKMTAASISAILIAALLGLDFAVSAGIVAILTIAPTKKETLRTALGRLLAFVCALLIAGFCFWCLGFHTHAFFLYLGLFILLCHTMGWNSAIAMDSVLISHFLTFGNMGLVAVWNEVLIFLLGVGVGIAANLHLHKRTSYIEELKEAADQQIRTILSRMSMRIIDRDISDYNGDCFLVLRKAITAANQVAEENFNNQFRSDDTYDREYIQMRERQARVLYDMYKRVRLLQTRPLTAQIISDYLARLAAEFHRDNTAESLLADFYRLDADMKSRPLPVTREEFEDRAQLYTLLRDIEEFLQIKADFARGESARS